MEEPGEHRDRTEAIPPGGPSSTAALGSTEVEAETALDRGLEANTCIGGEMHAIGPVDESGLR